MQRPARILTLWVTLTQPVGGAANGPGPRRAKTRDELAPDSGCQEPLMAGSTNAIALVPMDPSGYDSSEPTAIEMVHARRQTGPGLPRVGAARHHLSHALAAPNRAGRGPDCATRDGGIGSPRSHLDCLGRSGFGAASGPVVLPGLHQLNRGAAPREAWVRVGND